MPKGRKVVLDTVETVLAIVLIIVLLGVVLGLPLGALLLGGLGWGELARCCLVCVESLCVFSA